MMKIYYLRGMVVMRHSTSFRFSIEHIFTGCICLTCQEQYFPYPEPFLEIVNYITNKVITFEVCENCIEELCHKPCQVCKKSFLVIPSKQLFIDPINVKVRCSTCQVKHVRVLI